MVVCRDRSKFELIQQAEKKLVLHPSPENFNPYLHRPTPPEIFQHPNHQISKIRKSSTPPTSWQGCPLCHKWTEWMGILFYIVINRRLKFCAKLCLDIIKAINILIMTFHFRIDLNGVNENEKCRTNVFYSKLLESLAKLCNVVFNIFKPEALQIEKKISLHAFGMPVIRLIDSGRKSHNKTFYAL